jgi:hypothetical protein
VAKTMGEGLMLSSNGNGSALSSRWKAKAPKGGESAVLNENCWYSLIQIVGGCSVKTIRNHE